MKTTHSERMRAEQVSAAVDQLLGDPSTELEHLDPADTDLLDTARHLARLPLLLGPMGPGLEQDLGRRLRLDAIQGRRRLSLRPAWAVAGLAAVLLAVMLLTPLGETAVASFMAVFRLGRTEVRITPADTPLPATVVAKETAVQQTLTLAEAQTRVPFAIPQPAHLPPGYQLGRVHSYTYPELPAWLPQPFFVELVYDDGHGGQLALRCYPIMLGEQASISGLNLQAAPIQDVRDVTVNGQPGVLLSLGTERTGATWQEVVWEQDDLILALSAIDLAAEDLMSIAESVR